MHLINIILPIRYWSKDAKNVFHFLLRIHDLSTSKLKKKFISFGTNYVEFGIRAKKKFAEF